MKPMASSRCLWEYILLRLSAPLIQNLVVGSMSVPDLDQNNIGNYLLYLLDLLP